MSEVNEQTEQTEIPTEFNKMIKDFVNDLMITFPDKVSREDFFTQEEGVGVSDATVSPAIYTFCKEVYPKIFFDILYENEDIFSDKSIAVELLPGINFTELWHEDITEKTKSTIWKYLQLILFSIVTEINSEESFGDTAKLFEAINQDEFKQKIEETIAQMDSIFNSRGHPNNPDDINDETGREVGNESGGEGGMEIPTTNLPDAEELHDHINSMMDGKLGCLAKEIAEETANDLDIDIEDANSVDDVFKQLFKNPTKLMNLVKNVGSKLDNKIKSGTIKESELLEEASELVNKMKSMPGMNNFENMFSKMGMPGMGKGTKVDMGAFNSHMQQNLRAARMRDRMRTKLQDREKNDGNEEGKEEGKEEGNEEGKEEVSTSLEDIRNREELLKSLGINLDGMEQLIYSTGETVEKSSRPSTNRKKKKGHRKKK